MTRNTPPSIIFMGTPDFAVPCLEALYQAELPISLVVTQPDRPKGRGRQLAPPPVKIVAQKLHLPILQPKNIREPEVLERLSSLKPDFLVVVAFGQILPQSILDISTKGAINVHASLLPKYRGPAPIQWAIIRGETHTGITTMLMDRGVDTGDILLSTQTPIGPEENASSLHDRLAKLGADLLVQTIEQMWQGNLLPRSQKHTLATYAPMLSKQDGRINWQRPAHELDALVRAMNPWPGAFCFLKDKRYKILKACAIESNYQAAPGAVVPGFSDELRIATGQGALSILKIQVASGKCMQICDFLYGHPICPGELFS